MDTDAELQQIERASYEIDSHRDGDYTPEWAEYCRMQIGAAEKRPSACRRTPRQLLDGGAV